MKFLAVLALLVAPLTVQSAPVDGPRDHRPGYHGGHGHHGHDWNRPRPRGWRADCRVVLETQWGSDMQSFYGRGFDRYSRHRALQDARRDGIRQCERARGGRLLLKCNVDEGNCRAYPSRR